MESIELLAVVGGILLIAGVSKRIRDTIITLPILYVLTVLGTDDIAGRDVIYNVAMITVFFSVMAHGISASPLADWYGERVAALDEKGLADAETAPVPEMSTRTGSVPGASSSSA